MIGPLDEKISFNFHRSEFMWDWDLRFRIMFLFGIGVFGEIMRLKHTLSNSGRRYASIQFMVSRHHVGRIYVNHHKSSSAKPNINGNQALGMVCTVIISYQ